ncbi:DUF6197 family protein [Streptomyces sp. G35A]
MTETLTGNPFTADAITQTALEAAQKRPDFWVGYSGETITGAETADFLHDLQEVLEKRGWIRSFRDDDPQVPEPDESLSVKAMILTLWRYAREVLEQNRGPLTLGYARFEVNDQDVIWVVDRVLNALVAARTGTSSAQASAWASRRSRTWDDVRDLLTAAAAFARTHGPR